MKQQSFEKFYYTKVGLGEGCGCAERVIDLYEAERQAGRSAIPAYRPKMGIVRALRRLLRRLSSEPI